MYTSEYLLLFKFLVPLIHQNCDKQTNKQTKISSGKKISTHIRVRIMVLNATFNNISVISWRSVIYIMGHRVAIISRNDSDPWYNRMDLNHLFWVSYRTTYNGIRWFNQGHYALVATSADSVPLSYLVRITIAPIGTTFGNLQ